MKDKNPNIIALNKLFDGMILPNYPMLDNILLHDVDGIWIVQLFLNDDTITSENMYKKGLDPHYLVDKHIINLLPYMGIKKPDYLGWVLIGSDGKTIDNYLG